MCEVSDKLQLCTCSEVDFDHAKHYWILHRFVKGQKVEVVGEPVMPFCIDEETDVKNRTLLKTLLNEKAVFDKPLQPREADLLELSFQVNDELERITYGYKYAGGKWEEEEYDVFEWMTHHKELKQGTIKNGLKNEHD